MVVIDRMVVVERVWWSGWICMMKFFLVECVEFGVWVIV